MIIKNIHWLKFIGSIIIITLLSLIIVQNYHIENSAPFKTVLLYILTHIVTVFLKVKAEERGIKVNLHKVKKVFPKIFQKKPPPILPEKD
jgi:hypothetical protein